jgi:hypothetical protein
MSRRDNELELTTIQPSLRGPDVFSTLPSNKLLGYYHKPLTGLKELLPKEQK